LGQRVTTEPFENLSKRNEPKTVHLWPLHLPARVT
jgi:hypothetical protein